MATPKKKSKKTTTATKTAKSTKSSKTKPASSTKRATPSKGTVARKAAPAPTKTSPKKAAPKKPAASKPAPKPAPKKPILPPTNDEIRARAHQIWEQGGRRQGGEKENWLEAERQLRAERGL
jgi:hypothetical protein